MTACPQCPRWKWLREKRPDLGALIDALTALDTDDSTAVEIRDAVRTAEEVAT